MKKIKLFFVVFIMTTTALWAQDYKNYFTDKAMRFDFIHAGNVNSEEYFYVGVAEEPVWGGSQTQLIDPDDYGVQRVEVVDLKSGEVIYSKGYCTLFNEWLICDEAKTTSRAYNESLQFPFPKDKIKVVIYSRDKNGKMQKKFEQVVDPNHYSVSKRSPKYKTFDIQYNGHYSKKVDIVILSEGYAEDEYELFKKDCEKFTEAIFSYSPFKEKRRQFNVRAVWCPSKDSGVTIPGEHTWFETAFDGNFYTFDSERYFTIENYTKVCQAAGNVPYDAIYILGNTLKYGGGGIYNFYAMGSARNLDSAGEVHVHELGHSLVGLADEYAANGFSNDFYSSKVEPWEENLTTLCNFKSKKIWNSFLKEKQPVPTPVNSKNEKNVGVYEGGGYCEKGVYRPMINCMMRSFTGDKTFCPVCQKAIEKTIDKYTK